MHAPHQVPRPGPTSTRAQFDDGWDAYREKVFERQLALGILPPGTRLSARDPDVAAWNALAADEKRLYARMMEVFAGFLEHTDHQIGRLIEFLAHNGLLDNTIDHAHQRQRRQRGGWAARLGQREPVLQQRPRDAGGGPEGDRRAGRAEVLQPLSRGAGPGRATRRSGAGSGRPTAAVSPIRSSCTGRRGSRPRGELRDAVRASIDMVPTVLEALASSRRRRSAA